MAFPNIGDLIKAAQAGSVSPSGPGGDSVPPPPPIPGGDGGGAGPTPFAQTKAGIIFAGEQQKEALRIQRQNEQALARQKQRQALILQQREQAFQTQQLNRRIREERRIRAEEREAERKANIAQLRVERQAAFAQLVKEGDSVRAVIFAMGFGPENDAFDVRAKALGTSIRELKGARAQKRTTAQALGRVLGRDVTIGRRGVRGLGTVISSAKAFAQGGADVQQLLTSAFGVGSLKKGEQPGISAARLQELATEVIPTGAY